MSAPTKDDDTDDQFERWLSGKAGVDTLKPADPAGVGTVSIFIASAIECHRNQQPSADQQGDGDTTDYRENAVPAIGRGRFRAGSGRLCCHDTPPEVTHGSDPFLSRGDT